MHECGEVTAKRGRERISSWLSTEQEPSLGLSHTPQRSWPERKARVQCSADWATSVPLKLFLLGLVNTFFLEEEQKRHQVVFGCCLEMLGVLDHKDTVRWATLVEGGKNAKGIVGVTEHYAEESKYLGIIRRLGDGCYPLHCLFCCVATGQNKDWISASSLLWGGGWGALASQMV